MRLGVAFVATLAVSVVLSCTATWVLTYSSCYDELQKMGDGFSQLAWLGLGDFRLLVQQLNRNSTTLTVGSLDTECGRSEAQMNATRDQYHRTTADLLTRVHTANAQAQGQVAALVSYFGDLMQTVVGDFQAVATDYASRLRLESASRAQDAFHRVLRDRIRAIQMVARLYWLGAMNFSRFPDTPLDDGSCTLMATLCQVSAQLGLPLYIGSATGSSMLCDVAGGDAHDMILVPHPAADFYSFLLWPPFRGGRENFTAWKQSCLAGSNATFLDSLCPHGMGMKYPDYCNGTCGFDPRCRPWYVIHDPAQPPHTLMSDVYVDIQKGVPCVTLSFSIINEAARRIVGVVATDFFFDEVDLGPLPTLGVPQQVTLIFNSSDLLVVASNRPCSSGQAAGVSIAKVCDPGLRLLGRWLGGHRGLAAKASLELDGTLWDVFPSSVDGISYFVAVGMNRTEVYAVITATDQAAHDTLQAISHQQPARMAALESVALAEMDGLASQRLSNLQAAQAEHMQHESKVHFQAEQMLNVSQLQSTAELERILGLRMPAVQRLKDYHMTQLVNNIGPTCGAMAALLLAIILAATYGTRRLMQHVHRIARVLEDVAHMRVEEVQITWKSPVREVQSIEAALGVLVRRLAGYKSYMPAGLFQQTNGLPQTTQRPQPPLPPTAMTPSFRRNVSDAIASDLFSTSPVQLLRRSVAVMAVNVVAFQAEVAHRTEVEVAAALSCLTAAVHGAASVTHGNVDAVVGDQLLVTFNAHFVCADPPVAACDAALALLASLKADLAHVGQVQVGLAVGAVYAGHVGYASFKSLLAVGAALKVASLLAHLSDFRQPVVLTCPVVEERVKHRFTLRPVDRVALPDLGAQVPLYASGLTVSLLEARRRSSEADPESWLYVETPGSPGEWAITFQQVVEASSVEAALDHLRSYVDRRPDDWLARRLLSRLARWQPGVGLVLAERPDPVPPTAPLLLPALLPPHS